MATINPRATREGLAAIGSSNCGTDVVRKFVIGEFFRAIRALDQVQPWFGGWRKSIYCGPETASNKVSMHRIGDLSANCVGHADM